MDFLFLFCPHECFIHSERKCVHEDFLHDGWRRNQVLQLQVEDPLQTLCAQSPQLRQFAQQPTQTRLRSTRVRATAAADVGSQAGDQAVLKFFNAFGFF